MRIFDDDFFRIISINTIIFEGRTSIQWHQIMKVSKAQYADFLGNFKRVGVTAGSFFQLGAHSEIKVSQPKRTARWIGEFCAVRLGERLQKETVGTARLIHPAVSICIYINFGVERLRKGGEGALTGLPVFLKAFDLEARASNTSNVFI